MVNIKQIFDKLMRGDRRLVEYDVSTWLVFWEGRALGGTDSQSTEQSSTKDRPTRFAKTPCHKGKRQVMVEDTTECPLWPLCIHSHK